MLNPQKKSIEKCIFHVSSKNKIILYLVIKQFKSFWKPWISIRIPNPDLEDWIRIRNTAFLQQSHVHVRDAAHSSH